MEVEKYEISYWSVVVRKDLPRIDGVWRDIIKQAIAGKLAINPNLFGTPLRQTLRGYRKLRIANYRVIYRIERREVKIIAIGHRSEVYKEMMKRIGKYVS